MLEDNLLHFNHQGRAHMVDVTDKTETKRTAIVKSQIHMREETLQRIQEGSIRKGDVLAVAQVAGIMAAKKTADLIPMCHPLPLAGIDITFAIEDAQTLSFRVQVKTMGVTGVEMEALTAAQVVGLTIYDMCKAIDKDMLLGPTYLEQKQGGKSGDYVRANS
ncbi:cyclic pyranopterin monophosphate synthase MoaC [Paenibacillus sp. UMB4589-SE434]|uniref:cyclic pyranopterin monophosphate synthase MoaC n=1 Tax=Paenibacillus sp. UMB4589-SE434 TaxID=3046314 RepID=UPI00254F486C|nr:cyclic pyranopterin monophosphate synthase MoaC [Paenibacillus sp. UMB4589-SE434]MDK8180206.1 cyclic pyranopterin monophosphate synthase MoaC [Paenibacillus sp. UMB4589-SE434]